MILPPPDNYAHLMPVIDFWEMGQAQFLGNLLYRVVKPRSVIDWGCATGLYLVSFKQYGCRVLGVDAEVNAGTQLVSHEFMRTDIRQIVYFPQRYDLALCIEVAEHLQPEYADVLVDNVAASADTIFWSAAHPGQGGDYHYNEQPKKYWLEKFQARGFDLHPQNDDVCEQIAANPECQKVQWLIPNAMLLQRIK